MRLDDLFPSKISNESNPAVIHHPSGSSISYPLLSSLSLQLSCFLKDTTCNQTPIGVFCSPSIALIVAILGIFKSHNIYVPLDSTYPQGRITTMFELIDLKIIIVNTSCWESKSHEFLRNEANNRGITIVVLSDVGEIDFVLQNQNTKEIKTQNKKDKDFAYVMFTSGTTGLPKSVWVPHECVVSNIKGLKSLWGVNCKDIIPLASPIAFDPSIIDIFVCLSGGGTLITVDSSHRASPLLFTAALQKYSATILQITPSHARRISSCLENMNSLRVLTLGGEPLPNGVDKNTSLYNIYGITEVSVWAMCHKVDLQEDLKESQDKGVLLGHLKFDALPDTECIVFDDSGKEVFEGVGILWIGGTKRQCIIEGPTNQSDNENDINENVMKKRKLLPQSQKSYLVSTKDEVRVSNGKVWHIGRVDERIKVLGAAVHPREQHPDVRAAWVIPFSLQNNTTVLVGIIIPHTKQPNLEENHYPILESTLSTQIRKTIHKLLPSHMWPFWIITMANISDIPVTINGKVSVPDLVEKCKLALDNNSKQIVSQNFDRMSIVETITQIWANALPDWQPDNSNITQQHFLNLGGSSLSVIWCVEKIICEFGLDSGTLGEELRQEISTTMLHKPLQELIELVSRHLSSLSTSEPVLSSFQKAPFVHTIPSSPIKLGKIQYYSGRAGSSYCFKCSSPSCLHLNSGKKKPSEENKSNTETNGIAWRAWLAKCVDSSPLVVTRIVNDETKTTCYVGSHKGVVLAVDAADGTVLWTCDVATRVESSPAISNDGFFLYVGGYDGRLFCIDCSTGKVIYSYQTDHQVKSSPYVSKETGNVWVGSHDKSLHCISSNNVCVAKFTTQSAIFSSPIIDEERRVVYFGSQDGHLYSISTSMELNWKKKLGAPIFSSPTIDNLSGHIYCGCCDGNLYCIDFNGETIWSFQTSKPIYTSPCLPFVDPPVVLFGSHDGNLYCLSRNDGKLIWKFAVLSSVDGKESIVYSSPNYYILQNEEYDNNSPKDYSLNICVCNTDGDIYILNWSNNKNNNEVKLVKNIKLTKPIFSSPVWINENQLVVGCRDNYLYSIIY